MPSTSRKHTHTSWANDTFEYFASFNSCHLSVLSVASHQGGIQDLPEARGGKSVCAVLIAEAAHYATAILSFGWEVGVDDDELYREH